jgi:hypothetical protein
MQAEIELTREHNATKAAAAIEGQTRVRIKAKAIEVLSILR